MTKKIKIIICAGILIIIAAIGIFYYFNVKTKTPEYALKIVKESIINHDKENFYKHVDLENILATKFFEETWTLN